MGARFQEFHRTWLGAFSWTCKTPPGSWLATRHQLIVEIKHRPPLFKLAPRSVTLALSNANSHSKRSLTRHSITTPHSAACYCYKYDWKGEKVEFLYPGSRLPLIRWGTVAYAALSCRHPSFIRFFRYYSVNHQFSCVPYQVAVGSHAFYIRFIRCMSGSQPVANAATNVNLMRSAWVPNKTHV